MKYKVEIIHRIKIMQTEGASTENCSYNTFDTCSTPMVTTAGTNFREEGRYNFHVLCRNQLPNVISMDKKT